MADVCAGPSSSSDSGPCSSKMATAADKRSERLKKLRELHMKRVCINVVFLCVVLSNRV